jgi:hypothetical protein
MEMETTRILLDIDRAAENIRHALRILDDPSAAQDFALKELLLGALADLDEVRNRCQDREPSV